MKIRFGALALVVMLAACSGQDQTKTGNSQKEGQASATSPGVGSAISGYSNDSKRTLGNAPDRGELFGYKKGAAVLHKGAYTLRPIALSEEHAIRGVATGMMTIPAPNGEQIKIRYQRHEESPDGNWSWIGHVVGGDAAREAIITFGEHAVFGSIPQANGPSLQLTTEHGVAYLVQADASRLLRGVRAGGDAKVPAAYGASSTHETEALVASATQKIQTQALGVSTKAVPAANTVDLVAGYSSGLATRLGGASIAVTKLNNLVAAANLALSNSNINGRIRLVNALQVSYADNTDNGAALNELTGNNGTGPVTVPASLAPLRTARETYGADLVTLVRDFKSENNGCGIAWLLGANQSPITVAGDAPFAFSVVSEGNYDLSGSTYYCEDITLMHELAHNMGSAHDVGNAGGNSGRYPYSYGYKTAAAQGNFFTVMAYGDNNQTLYRVFSNPLITTCGGLACGVANQADNARSLNQTMPVAATFRNTVVPFVSGLNDDSNGDGRSDIFWNNPTQGGMETWLMNGTSWAYSPASAVGNQYRVAGIGDFNGDGLADILWYDLAKTTLWQWQKRADGGYNVVNLRSYPAGWTVAGIGDANGDGRADIFWHNPTQGSVEVWLMNGVAWTYGGAKAVGSQYRIAGIGDFNGDGRSDILWHDLNKTVLYQWQSKADGTYDIVYLRPYPVGWDVVGIGHANNDGRADVFWHNPTQGSVQTWLMNGTAWAYGPVNSVGTQFRVADIGDFNGDGLADLIWHDQAKTALYQWQAIAAGGYTIASLKSYPAGWEIVK